MENILIRKYLTEFGTKRLHIVLLIVRNYLKQFNTWRLDAVQKS